MIGGVVLLTMMLSFTPPADFTPVNHTAILARADCQRSRVETERVAPSSVIVETAICGPWTCQTEWFEFDYLPGKRIALRQLGCERVP